jgi:hypothetical protein
MQTEQTPTAETTDPVTAIRRQLVTASVSWQKRSIRDDGNLDPAACMAANYAYTLAAALKLVQDHHGTDAAEQLAREVDEILTDGDFDDINADVTPGSTT